MNKGKIVNIAGCNQNGACGLILFAAVRIRTFQSDGTNHGCSRFASSFTPRGDIRGDTAGNEGDRRAFR